MKKKDRENELGAKCICVNNGMVFKFRFVAFAEICVLVDKTNRIDKFIIKQIEQINLELNKQNKCRKLIFMLSGKNNLSRKRNKTISL